MLLKFDEKFIQQIKDNEHNANQNGNDYVVTINPDSTKSLKEFVPLAVTALFDLSRCVSAIPTLVEKIDQVLSSVNHALTRVTSLDNRCTELKTEVDSLKIKCEKQELTISAMKDQVKNLESNFEKQVSEMKDQIRNQEIKFEKEVKKNAEASLALERYSRDYNLRISNVKEEKNETAEMTVKKTKQLIQDVTGIDLAIEFGHRTGKSINENPRTIIVKLMSRLQKREFMKKRKEMFAAGYPVFNDLPRADLEEKLKHSKTMQNKFNNNEKVMFQRGHWFVNGVIYKES